MTAFNNLLIVTDARGNTTTHEYDPMDRLSARTDPLTRTETFTYDGVGNLLSTTDRKNQTTTFTYDPLNRRTQATYADGAVATFTYDAAGRLTLADDTADPHRPIALAYDPLDRLLAETTALGTVTYQYDPLGRRTQMTVAGQSPVAYAYDAASRLTQEPLAPVTLQYDPLGRRTLLALPNQVSTEYQYDPASRLTALIYRNALGPLGDLTYTYDAGGNRTSVGGSFARTLLPDPISTATYDAANQQLAFASSSMMFDANGSLTALAEPTGTTTFTWDARNRLSGLSGPATGASFQYDALGRRIQKVIGIAVATYQYDGLDVIREIRNGTEAIYLRSLNTDEPFIQKEISTSAVLAYLAEALGSTVALTDPSGAPVTSYTYDPFVRTLLEGAPSANPFQYASREHDAGVGLYFYRARYYHPGLGRFLSEDSIGLAGGEINLYAYLVRNKPLDAADPFGLLTLLFHGGPSSIGPGGSIDKGGNPGVNAIENALREQGETVIRLNSGQMSEALSQAQRARAAGEPVFVAGHSMGANAAIETSLWLLRLGIPPDHLITIDPVGPFHTVIPGEIPTTNFYQQTGYPLGEPLFGRNVNPLDDQLIRGLGRDAHFRITDDPRIQQRIQRIILGGRK